MDVRDATRLIAPAITRGERWAELGAGSGTFTAAIAALVGLQGHVYAIERDGRAIASLEQVARRARNDERSPITVIRADFTLPLDLPALDGALFANSLHYVPDAEQPALLARTGRSLAEGGALVVVEYDDRPRSRWVPFPISLSRLAALAAEAGLGAPEVIGRQKSAFGGTMYAARMRQR